MTIPPLKPVQSATSPRLKTSSRADANDDPQGEGLARAVAAIDNARRQRALAGSAAMRRYWWYQLEAALEKYNKLLPGEPARVRSLAPGHQYVQAE